MASICATSSTVYTQAFDSGCFGSEFGDLTALFWVTNSIVPVSGVVCKVSEVRFVGVLLFFFIGILLFVIQSSAVHWAALGFLNSFRTSGGIRSNSANASSEERR